MISLDKIKKSLIEDLTEQQIVEGLNLLSNTFNIERAKIDSVYKRRQVIASYACFYLPTNMLKMSFTLGKLSQELISEIKGSTIIDIGCGPGTYIFAMIEHFKDTSMSFVGIDHHPLMLEQARKIHQNLYDGFSIHWAQDFPRIEGKKTVIFGNSINEMGHMQALKLIKKVKPDIIIAIEPGTMNSFEEVKSLRGLLIKDKFHVNFPCPGNGSCPMDKDNWCHQVIKASLDHDLERLSQLIQKDRKTMPATIQVFSKVPQCSENRIIRLEKNQKHAFLWNMCIKENEESNSFKRIEVPKRGLSKKEIKTLENYSTGFSVEYSSVKILSNNLLRITLDKFPTE